MPTNRCGVYVVRVFHLYKGFWRKHSSIGNFVKTSVLNTKPDNWIKKKTKAKLIVVSSKKERVVRGGLSFKFFYNTGILLKHRMNVYGTEVLGPTTRLIKRRKFLLLFFTVL